jgi:acyl-CoA thioesterase YciA
MAETAETPRGDLSIRTIAMPADTNPAGDIFGGWLMSQMDLGGGTFAGYRARSRVVTVAVDAFTFHKPVYVGDELTIYCTETRRGRTSITVWVEAWVRRCETRGLIKVTAGHFTFVAIGEDGMARPIPAAGGGADTATT